MLRRRVPALDNLLAIGALLQDVLEEHGLLLGVRLWTTLVVRQAEAEAEAGS